MPFVPDRQSGRGRRAICVAVALCLWGVFVSRAHGEESPESPETPVEYEAFALKQSDDLKAIYVRWQARRAEARAERSSWPQPKINYRTFINGWWLEGNRATHRAHLAQTFPWPGVLDKAAQPARRRAEAMRHRFQARALEIVLEVRRHLIEVARLESTRSILREQLELYEDVIANVRTSVEADQADYGDLLRVNTTRETIEDELDQLRAERRQTIAELRDVLELSPDVELTFDFEGDHDPLDVPEAQPEREPLVEAARRHHPDLAVARSEASAHRARAEYARARRLPWPTVMLGVRSMPDRMRLSGYDRRTALFASVTLPVPIFGQQYRREEQQFEHRREAVRAERRETTNALSSQIEGTLSRIDEKRRRLRRYREELLPLADDATEQMLQNIETGERTVTDYLLSFEQQLELETNLVDFRAAIARERARLEELTGGEFEAYPNRETPTIEIRDVAEEEREP